MSDQPKQEEKKIIVAEDWKSQVEAEKAAAEQGQPQAADSPDDSSAGPPPPPTLTFLAGSLYLQGMMSLGLLPSPGSDTPEVHLDHAQHTIDMLQMLQEKTEGNRTPEESKEFDQILPDLRMAYLGVQQQASAPPTPTDK